MGPKKARFRCQGTGPSRHVLAPDFGLQCPSGCSKKGRKRRSVNAGEGRVEVGEGGES